MFSISFLNTQTIPWPNTGQKKKTVRLKARITTLKVNSLSAQQSSRENQWVWCTVERLLLIRKRQPISHLELLPSKVQRDQVWSTTEIWYQEIVMFFGPVLQKPRKAMVPLSTQTVAEKLLRVYKGPDSIQVQLGLNSQQTIRSTDSFIYAFLFHPAIIHGLWRDLL